MTPTYAFIDVTRMYHDPETGEHYYRAQLFNHEEDAHALARDFASDKPNHDVVVYRPFKRYRAKPADVKSFIINEKMEVIPE